MVVARLGEALARRIERRRLAKRVAAATFGWTAAWATRGLFGASALAVECQDVTELDCTCNFPWGFCKERDPTYCDGAACSGSCNFDFSYYPTTACWCTKECKHGKLPNGYPKRGYYKCCDCTCPTPPSEPRCGCQRLIRTNQPIKR